MQNRRAKKNHCGTRQAQKMPVVPGVSAAKSKAARQTTASHFRIAEIVRTGTIMDVFSAFFSASLCLCVKEYGCTLP